MKIEIKKGLPPNFDEIVKVFPAARRVGVIFAYAPFIYVTASTHLPQQLVNHEAIHIKRQEEIGVEEWWRRYLVDPEFRFAEELLAHQEEYRTLMTGAPSRQVRRQALKQVASRLSSALYGGVISLERAMIAIKAGVEHESE